MTNTLYFGDNLHVLREYVKDESVDLVYLDPPFNSNAAYNVLFKSPVGDPAAAQIRAFGDTWRWGDEAEIALKEVRTRSPDTFKLLQAMRTFLHESDVMAYLAMMAVRLIELRRVLKETGSLYLHCDPGASHYLKILLDGIFGAERYRNEITWKRSSAHSDGKQGARHYGRITDTILFYSKGASPTWNVTYRPYDQKYIERDYRRVDESGRRYRLSDIQGPGRAEKGNPYYEVMGVFRHWRYSKEKMDDLIAQGRIIQTRPGAVPQYKRYLDEMPGIPAQSLWDDIQPINNRSKELMRYQTQKPLALLERIIQVSSNPGDLILDPFCGCGTAIHASEQLGRSWIGIDITYLAIQVIEDRIKTRLPQARYEVKGIPETEDDARALAARDPYQFQLWAVGRLGGISRGKGADQGIDGEIVFQTGRRDFDRSIISVKAGQHVGPSMISALRGTMEREGAAMGVFVCVNPPTSAMQKEAASAGRVDLLGRDRPRIQIVTAKELTSRVDLGFVTALNTLQAAEAALEAERRRPPLPPTPEEIRRSPSMAMPIPGKGQGRGRKRDATDQPPLALVGGKANKGPALQLDMPYTQPEREYPMAAEEAAPAPAPPKKRRKAG